MVKSKIINVVATASLNQPIDFEELRKHKEIFHDPDVYGGRVAYFKTPGMEGKVSIFLSGKMISVGTKSESQAYKELKVAAKFLVDKGLAKAIELQPITQNLVATADFEKCINLEKIAEETRAIYEPDQFPGLILKVDEPYKASLLIFASGKAVIAGLKGSDQITPILKRLEEIVNVDF